MPWQAIKDLTGGNGVDVAIEAVGLPQDVPPGVRGPGPGRHRCVRVGVARPDRTQIHVLPFIEVFGRGGALKSSWYGDCLPTRDFPLLVDLYQQGRLDLDAFVTEEIGIDDVEAAFEKMHGGNVLRSVVLF